MAQRTGSHPSSAGWPRRSPLVLGWGTTREPRVLTAQQQRNGSVVRILRCQRSGRVRFPVSAAEQQQQSNWLPWLSRQSGRLLTDRSPVRARVGARGRVAQSVEHWSNKPTVAGSIPVTTSDTLAEWLRRQPAKLLGFSRTGSNPVGVEARGIRGRAGLRRQT